TLPKKPLPKAVGERASVRIVAHAPVRAASRIVSTLFRAVATGARTGVETSDGRSLSGASLAAKTSVQPFLCFQRLAPRFLESLDVARTSACATLKFLTISEPWGIGFMST